MGKGNFLAVKGQPIVSYRNCLLWAVEKLLNWLICRLGCWVGGTRGTITWGQDPLMGRGNYSKRKEHTPTCPTTLCHELCKMAEPIEMPFGLRTWVGRRKHVLHGAHWCHLANTTETSVCSGNAALCQITLTTCYYCIPFDLQRIYRRVQLRVTHCDILKKIHILCHKFRIHTFWKVSEQKGQRKGILLVVGEKQSFILAKCNIRHHARKQSSKLA